MIKIALDHHDFLCAIEGFARGSHLRQHVWKEIVWKSIPQMNENDMDFLWYFMRRDIWECYFHNFNGEVRRDVGWDDFLRVMAALHRGNRSIVSFKADDGKLHRVLCYKYEGKYCPMYQSFPYQKKMESFGSYIPNEWVASVKTFELPENPYIERGDDRHWRNDLSLYSSEVLSAEQLKPDEYKSFF